MLSPSCRIVRSPSTPSCVTVASLLGSSAVGMKFCVWLIVTLLLSPDCVTPATLLSPIWVTVESVSPVEPVWRSEEHTSELQSLMRISYAVFCLKKKKHINTHHP